MSPAIDVLIVGAGISGISMAAHLKKMCPARSFTIIERRDRLGGTWDLFRYPGVRSDSDMHSLGFGFQPWRGDKAIAGGADILAYLDRTVEEHEIAPHIRYACKVVSADWDEAAALWRVTLEDDGGWHHQTARFLYLASGYYDHDEPHDAALPGLEDFAGQIVHPQSWPQDLDYAGRRVVVIGSGATAVTIVPAMATSAAHVIMLQRTPTWMIAQPSRNALALKLRKLLPERLAYKVTRTLNTRLHALMFKRSLKAPAEVAAYLTRRLRKQLGDAFAPEHFTPPYGPWEQRLCLVPDGDLFAAIHDGSASIVTGRIDRIEATGALLENGTRIPADIIVTATGLKLALGGKIDVSIGGKRIDWAERWFYRNCMFSNVPNLSVVFGYLNASWTLRADMTAAFTCRVLNTMAERGTPIAVPVRAEEGMAQAADPRFGFSSGYLDRAADLMPRSEASLPWRLNMDYFEDVKDYRKRPVDDGILTFRHPEPEHQSEAAA